jgi:plasmid stability protein
MSVNLSVKNVPDALAERLRRRAAANRRSLQRELLGILESAVGYRTPSGTADGPTVQTQHDAVGEVLTIEDLADLSRKLFPRETESSVAYLRRSRDHR